MAISILATRLLAAAAFMMLASSSVACSGAPSNADPGTSDEATGQSADELSRARFTSLRAPTNPELKALYAAGKKFESSYMGVYRFNKPALEATDPDARQKRIKEVMHVHMCRFFDESIDIGRNTGSTANRVKSALSDVDMANNASDQDADVAGFSDALTNVYGDSKLDVLSGGASGNNTMGEIMGIYDIKHHEVFFFGFTNCGSDD